MFGSDVSRQKLSAAAAYLTEQTARAPAARRFKQNDAVGIFAMDFAQLAIGAGMQCEIELARIARGARSTEQSVNAHAVAAMQPEQMPADQQRRAAGSWAPSVAVAHGVGANVETAKVAGGDRAKRIIGGRGEPRGFFEKDRFERDGHRFGRGDAAEIVGGKIVPTELMPSGGRGGEHREEQERGEPVGAAAPSVMPGEAEQRGGGEAGREGDGEEAIGDDAGADRDQHDQQRLRRAAGRRSGAGGCHFASFLRPAELRAL